MKDFLLLGLLYSCGSVKSKSKIELQTGRKELAEIFSELIKKIGEPEIKETSKIIVSVKHKTIGNFFCNFGIKLPLNKNILPTKILNTSEKRVSFLKGFFEGKSSVSVKSKIIKISGKKEQLEQLKKLLNMENVNARIYKNKNYFSLYIEGKNKCMIFRHKIGFLTKEKKDKLEKIVSFEIVK